MTSLRDYETDTQTLCILTFLLTHNWLVRPLTRSNGYAPRSLTETLTRHG